MNSTATYYDWSIFAVIFVVLLVLDLCVANRGSEPPRLKTAAMWVGVWVSSALAFAAYIFATKGIQSGTEFLSGYMIEQALSVDNLFVFIIIFSYFGVKPEFQRRVLFYGIMGALVMRAIFIAAGVTLLHHFEWLTYLLGALLLYTGIKILKHDMNDVDPGKNPVIRLAKKFLPMTDSFSGEKFWVRENGSLLATPLLLVLISIEVTDLIFAIDSIPAVLAITRDPFIVFTSNVFAVVGLRSLYFVVSGAMQKLHYLNHGLALILIFVGSKMLFIEHHTLPTWTSLVVITVCLGGATLASLFKLKSNE